MEPIPLPDKHINFYKLSSAYYVPNTSMVIKGGNISGLRGAYIFNIDFQRPLYKATSSLGLYLSN